MFPEDEITETRLFSVAPLFRVFVPHLANVQSTGGRHYSDRLCSDSPQSRRPSTSLARLTYVETV